MYNSFDKQEYSLSFYTMNEVRLDGEQRDIVVAQAVRIMRQRIVGSIQALQINHVDQEFLALREDDLGKKFPKIRENDEPGERRRKADLWPEELDVISVSRAIEEAVRELIASERPDISKPHISRGAILVLGSEVIDLLSEKSTEKIKLSPRIASSVQGNLEIMEQDISTLESLLREKMTTYESTLDEPKRGILAREINESLLRIEELNREVKNISDKYDFTSLVKKDSGWGEDDDTEIPDTDSGGLDILERNETDQHDILDFKENIGLSRSEQHLRGYLPEIIKRSEELFDESFTWWVEWQEWQRSSFHIRDYPESHRDMLEKMLHRKRIIAFYASDTLKREERRRAKFHKFGWPWLWKIRKYLPELEEEIQNILWKIQNITYTLDDDDVWDTEPVVTSDPASILENLEESLDYLYQKLETTLFTYTQFTSELATLTTEIRKITWDIIRLHWDLSLHCKKHNLESQHIAQASESSGESTDNAYLSVEEYLESPDFFEYFPPVLTTEKSDAERNLLVLCDISIADELLPAVLEWAKVELNYKEDDDSDCSNLQKMTILEEVLQIVLRRKMIIYFECSQHTKKHPNPESSLHLSALKKEIESMQWPITMLSNRIEWAEEPGNLGEELESEMHHLSRRRFDLFQTFVDAQDTISRQIIGSKILQLCVSLEKRRDTLFDAGQEIDVPDTRIEVAGLTYSESRLLRYVSPDICKWEKGLFAKKMPFLIQWWKSGRENKLDMEKAQTSHLSERKMMIYFFGMKRIEEIDIELCSWEDCDHTKLVAERDEIGRHASELNEEIKPLLQRLKAMNESRIPTQENQKRLFYQELYNEAMKVLWSLDGIITHTEGEHAKLVRDYWIIIQKQILNFSEQIQEADSKWNLHKIPALQEEFDKAMSRIIEEIEQYLSKILEKQWHTGNEQHILTAEIHRIREKLFGRDQKN